MNTEEDKFAMLPDLEVFYGSSQQYDDIQWQSQLPIISSIPSSSSSLHNRREDRDREIER
jgi:hypothetical protein